MVMIVWLFGCAPAVVPSEAHSSPASRGEALFAREWVPGDELAGADGLGPLFNDASCSGCHAQGGPGGAGGLAHNTELVDGVLKHKHDLASAYELAQREEVAQRVSGGLGGIFGASGQSRSERNTPALWGSGLIDQIPDAVLLAQLEAEPDANFPDVTGRLTLDEDGRPGRFGWKGDVPTLASFVGQACSNELGLSVPEPGAAGPTDLSAEDVADMTAFIGGLPAPPAVEAPTEDGKSVFAALGCASCHTPSLGGVEGLYSDLMLHDMGPGLSSTIQSGSYGRPLPVAAEDDGPSGPASAQEWRTPPLWGLAATGPYLHDGRADSIVRAIAMHGGEAEASQRAWALSSTEQRAALMGFLTSLEPPSFPQKGAGVAASQ